MIERSWEEEYVYVFWYFDDDFVGQKTLLQEAVA